MNTVVSSIHVLFAAIYVAISGHRIRKQTGKNRHHIYTMMISVCFFLHMLCVLLFPFILDWSCGAIPLETTEPSDALLHCRMNEVAPIIMASDVVPV